MAILIPLTGLTTFGDMTQGGGLAAIFDSNSWTAGRKEATVGYAGVVFNTLKNIDSVQLDSALNGFDASGLSTSITLELYAKESGTPSSGTDGTLLGSLSFTDTESVLTKTITSSNKSTLFNCAWIRITTGVWANCVEARFYTNPPSGASATISNENGASCS